MENVLKAKEDKICTRRWATEHLAQGRSGLCQQAVLSHYPGTAGPRLLRPEAGWILWGWSQVREILQYEFIMILYNARICSTYKKLLHKLKNWVGGMPSFHPGISAFVSYCLYFWLPLEDCLRETIFIMGFYCGIPVSLQMFSFKYFQYFPLRSAEST